MSPENMDALHDLYRRWSAGDFRAAPDLFDANFLFVMRPEFPDAGAYLGLERLGEYMAHFLEPWTHLRIEAEAFTAAGDSVVVAVRQTAAGDGSGATTEFRYFQVWTFRGPRLIRLENFRERPEALAAVGLGDGEPAGGR